MKTKTEDFLLTLLWTCNMLSRPTFRNLTDSFESWSQHSVWITPDPVSRDHHTLGGQAVNVESLILLNARPAAGETDEQIVAGAWDFPVINRGYQRHLEILAECPEGSLQDKKAATVLQRWARQERAAWQEAVSMDPLLPECLLPADYVGIRAWQERLAAMAKVAEQIRSFKRKV